MFYESILGIKSNKLAEDHAHVYNITHGLCAFTFYDYYK